MAEREPAGIVKPIDKELLDACIHCGLCLPACPTYLATGREMESPRGRIYLLAQWNDGEQELSPRMAEHIETCLGCLGCQTACPSGVQYGKILSAARPHIAELRPAPERAIMRFAFKGILPNYPLLHLGGFFLKWWQKLRLGSALKWLAMPTSDYESAGERGQLINPLRKLLYKLSTWEQLTPSVPDYQPLAAMSTTRSENGRTMQLFKGCVMDVFYNDVNHACARLLRAQGCQVCVPEQTCCGALAMHAGEEDIAAELAKRNIELFEKTDGKIAVTAAGCGAMLKEYGELLAHEPAWAQRAHQFSARVIDITQALADGQFSSADATKAVARFGSPLRIAYHAACHLAHAQSIREAPEGLLSGVARDLNAKSPAPIVSLKPLREGEHCCGSAGIYNLLHTEISMKVLERKMDLIEETGATVVVTTNPGCMLQLQAGARVRGLSLSVAHLCELLDLIYSEPDAV